MFQFCPRPQYSRLSISSLANWIFFQHPLQLDELMHFRVPPTLWIACVYCIWTVINITSYYFVTYLQKKVNGFNAALYRLDMAKNRQEFAVCLKGRYLTYWRASSSHTKSSYLAVIHVRQYTICWLMESVLFSVPSINILLYIASYCLLDLTFCLDYMI